MDRHTSSKKLFTWLYSYGDIDYSSPINVDVQVSLNKKNGTTFLSASSPLLPEDIIDTDVNSLYEKTLAVLNMQAEIKTNADWEDWLEIIVSGETQKDFEGKSKYSNFLSGNMNIEVKQIKRGIKRETGEIFTINSNGAAVPFPKPTRLGDESLTDGMRMETPKERSYVPATAHNIKALNNIIERMAALRNGLSDLLSHENVGHAQNISVNIGLDAQNLLPEP